jgi:ABC-2 type transport system permease protein
VCIEIAVVAGGVLLLHTAAGLALWTGAAISGAPLGLGSALAGALNAAPIAWLGLAAAAFALGWLPSAVAAIGALPVAGGFLLDIITQNAKAPRWLTDLSPFAHLAAVPDVPPDWLATGGLGLIAAVVIAVGVTGYSRRDLDT